MQKTLILFFSLITFVSSAQSQKSKELKLWYNKPASLWEEALPLGNGRIGAMIWGNPLREIYQLNENTLWSGAPADGNNPEAKEVIPTIRRAIDEGNYKLAAELWKNNAQGPYTARYLPMADLHLNIPQSGPVQDIYRDLNISKAIATVGFEMNGVKYIRESFISYPDQVMVINLKTDKKRALNFDVSLNSLLRFTTTSTNDYDIILKGKAPYHVAHRMYESPQIAYDETGEKGMDFELHVKIKLKSGKIKTNDNILSVTNADEAVLLVSAATSFNGFDKSSGSEGRDPSFEAKRDMEKAKAKSYEALLQSHLNDYCLLFNRVNLNLNGQNKQEDIPTDERLKRFVFNDSDHNLVVLYYQFGRYLAIASSRGDGQPSNLQGIWNRHVQPPWGSNYTTNINTQMNYWLTNPTGLSECNQPLFNLIKHLSINGRKTAQVNYGIDSGWVAHHNSDIWAQTAPTGGYNIDPAGAPRWSCWPMAGMWLSRHLWEHYAFGGDTDFLRKTAYPLMKGAAEFALKWLQEDESGYLVTNPSTSPENSFKYTDKDGKEQTGGLSKASTMDMFIIRDLFTNCIEAAGILGIDPGFSKELNEARSKLYPPHLGAKGQLQEWFEDVEDVDPEHRHVSHLFGLHPGRDISPRLSPALATAARRTLMLRGNGGTGWAMAWKINFWARLEDGNQAYQMLRNGLNPVIATNEIATKGGGTYPNLFCAHPPFQIDGNLGSTAGITEMLLQSHAGEIFLLPALPDNWPDGNVHGLQARGGFTVDMEWRNAQLTKVIIYSKLGGNCRIRAHNQLKSNTVKLKDAKGKNSNRFYFSNSSIELITGNNAGKLQNPEIKNTFVLDFPTDQGQRYVLTNTEINYLE